MHKKPIYSFEDSTSLGIIDVPLLSVVAIENTAGLPELIVPSNRQALIIIINKIGMPASTTIAEFIADTTRWMWFYNGGIEGRFVKREGDTMYGALEFVANEGDASKTVIINNSNGTITTDGDVKAGGSLWSGHNTNVGNDLIVNKYFTLTDYDPPSMANGIRSYVRDGTWFINKNSGETNNLKIKLENKEVLTEVTGVLRTDWAKPTVGGIIKARRVGNVLYMTTNGNDA